MPNTRFFLTLPKEIVHDLLGALEFLPLYEGGCEVVTPVATEVLVWVRRHENRLRGLLSLPEHKTIPATPPPSSPQ